MSSNPPGRPTPSAPAPAVVSPAAHPETISAPASNGQPHGLARSVVGPRPRSSVWLSLTGWGILACLIAAGWYFREPLRPYFDLLTGAKKEAAPKPARVIPVTTAVVRKRDIPLYMNGLGTVTAFKTVTLRSRVEGELIDVAFTEGEVVKEGKLLAEIDPRAFQVQLAQAESQLLRDQATLKAAKLALDRYEELLAKKSISPQQVEDQAALVQQTAASIQADEATIDDANLQLSYCKIVAPISGRIGLRLVDKGNIVRANDTTGLAVITQLQPIALVFTIPQDDIARVQQQAHGEKPLTVDAFDRDFQIKLASGRLVAIDNQVDATTGTVRLKAEFENDDEMLFPNQFVNARLLVDTRRDAIVVPSSAIQRGPSSMYVYVVKKPQDAEKPQSDPKVAVKADKQATGGKGPVGKGQGGKRQGGKDSGGKVQAEKPPSVVELREVVIGPAEGGETCIESGLEPGEIVAIDGLDKLQPGSKVSPRDRNADADDKKAAGQADASKETEPAKAGKGDEANPDRRQPQPSTLPVTERPTASTHRDDDGDPEAKSGQKISPSCDETAAEAESENPPGNSP